MESKDKKLFKGRLQLFKNDENIIIHVKNDIAGAISYKAMDSYLTNICKVYG